MLAFAVQATYVLIDSRRGMMPIDFDWMCLLKENNVPFKIVSAELDVSMCAELDVCMCAELDVCMRF